jgi:hypothetical protein
MKKSYLDVIEERAVKSFEKFIDEERRKSVESYSQEELIKQFLSGDFWARTPMMKDLFLHGGISNKTLTNA